MPQRIISLLFRSVCELGKIEMVLTSITLTFQCVDLLGVVDGVWPVWCLLLHNHSTLVGWWKTDWLRYLSVERVLSKSCIMSCLNRCVVTDADSIQLTSSPSPAASCTLKITASGPAWHVTVVCLCVCLCHWAQLHLIKHSGAPHASRAPRYMRSRGLPSWTGNGQLASSRSSSPPVQFGHVTDAAGLAHHGLSSSPIGVPIGDAIRRIRRCTPCVCVQMQLGSQPSFSSHPHHHRQLPHHHPASSLSSRQQPPDPLDQLFHSGPAALFQPRFECPDTAQLAVDLLRLHHSIDQSLCSD